MEQELINNEIAKIFSMYMPCKTMQHGNDFDRMLVGIGGFEDNGYCYGRLKNKASVANVFVTDFQIILTPLSDITDAHAAIIADMNRYDKNANIKVRAKVGRDILNRIFVDNYKNHPICLPYECADYLRELGYALPYKGIDLFELGIAIPSNQSTKQM